MGPIHSTTPDVSVVMGVYDGAVHLPETIQSVLGQEEVELEFIIVDDGSTDGTAEILAETQSRDARIKVVHQQNRGLTAALIAGCAQARGEFIARIDCGDTSRPDRLRRQAEALRRHEGCALVSCWTEFVGPEGEYLYTEKGGGRASAAPVEVISMDQRYGVTDGPTHHISVMFRTRDYERVDGYRSAFYFAQDWDLWYRLLGCGKYLTIDAPMCTARISVGSISTTWPAVQFRYGEQALEALRLREQGLSDAPAVAAAERIVRPETSAKEKGLRVAESNYFIASLLVRNFDIRARRYVAECLKIRPQKLRYWVVAIRLLPCFLMPSRNADSECQRDGLV